MISSHNMYLNTRQGFQRQSSEVPGPWALSFFFLPFLPSFFLFSVLCFLKR